MKKVLFAVFVLLAFGPVKDFLVRQQIQDANMKISVRQSGAVGGGVGGKNS